MKREISELESKEYDLLILGAGAFGSSIAWEATSRGLSVAIIDKGDFCSATSANHLKMVHGGIRYLQHLDAYRVRESCRERTILLRTAPHLVKPIPTIFPTYGRGMEGKEVLAIGFFLYNLLTFDRNRGIKDTTRQIPNGKILNRNRCLELFPQLSETAINGAGLFCDGQFYNPPRLVLAYLRSAARLGAQLGNYLEVNGFLTSADRVNGIKVKDVLSGDQYKIRARMVLNATGPWAHHILKSYLGISLSPKPRFSRDLGFVINRKFSNDHALGVRIDSKDPDALLSRKGRHIFLVPWRDYTLVGVWHLPFDKNPDDITVSKTELQSYLDEMNAALPTLKLKFDDILTVNTGLTLFGDNDADTKDLSFGKRSILIDHSSDHQIDGLITLIGVRATTARGMAKQAVNLAFKKLDKNFVKSRTHELPLSGGQFETFEKLFQEANSNTYYPFSSDIVKSLISNYGANYEEVLKYIKEDPSFADPIGNTLTIKAEIIHAVREEMAIKLGDVIFRRTDIGTGEYPSEDTVRTSAEIMGNELGWTEKHIQNEIDDLKNDIFFRKE